MPRWLFQITLFVLLAANIELFSFYRLRVEGFETSGAWARRDATLGWRIAPNLDMDWYQTTPDVRTNADGLRTEVVPLHKAADEIRIMCLGGSVTFGVGLRESDTWPAVLQRMLEERVPRGMRVRVINAGQPGFNTAMSAALLDHLAARYQPDVVVGMFGFNDALGVDAWTGPTPGAMPRMRGALSGSATYRYLRARILSAQVAASHDRAWVPGEASPWRQSPRNLLGMRDYVSRWGGRFLLAVESTRAVLDTDCGRAPAPADYRRLESAYRRFGESAGVPVIVGNELFAASGLTDDDLFLDRDPVHPTPAGARILSARVAEELWRLSWVGTSGPGLASPREQGLPSSVKTLVESTEPVAQRPASLQSAE